MEFNKHIALAACEAPLRTSTKLRKMLADESKVPLACPGVYDGLSTRIALSCEFPVLYLTGAGISASRTGMADLGLATMTEMAQTAALVCNLNPDVPVIVDADTGYGGTLNVSRTVKEYIRAGVAAFHLEDQVVNKKCGHLEGKEVVGLDEYIGRIRAAVKTREQLGSDIVIIARTDALAVTGFDDALARLKAAVAAGADVAFMEAIKCKDEARKLCEIFNPMGVPVMYGMVQSSQAARISVSEAKQMGLSIIVYAGMCLAPTMRAVKQALMAFKENGDCEFYDDGKSSPKEFFKTFGLEDLQRFDTQVKRETAKVLKDSAELV
ncbi:hypothetical protein ACSS6W_002129 [Trichoderma asperelloides]|uniref:Carboxyvinyl-carboxyphosphonate phosphorylmutase n=1 Tax=Trichoderma asperellum TaxID=101201 RepID=A0A6V8QPU4_TRIAP|nr:methylisocitrate lyase [Trichoderma asperelloides]GFP54385.1 carboxyvinyl-carboxyphosphonate phosphorylmutase [Trichoderma asperellum]